MAQYAVIKGDTIVSKWFPTQDQALFEAYSQGLVRRNKRTDKLYLPQNVRVASKDYDIGAMRIQCMKWDGYPNV